MRRSLARVCTQLTRPSALTLILRPRSSLRSMSSAAPTPAFQYPATRQGTDVDTYFGTEVKDPYRWLEQPDAPETEAWVKAQNSVTAQYLAASKDRAPLVSRLTEAYNYERVSCPFRKGSYVFYFRNTGLQNQSVLYKQVGTDGEAQVLLDPNTLAEDGTAALGTYGFTESGAMLAYGVARSGSDWNTIHVMRVSDGQVLSDKVEWVKFSGISWTHDEAGFFYSRYPQPDAFKPSAPDAEADPNFKRGTETATVKGHMVYYHRVGTAQSEDVLVYQQPEEPEWTMGAEVTDDGLAVVLSMHPSCDTKNRLYILPLDAASKGFNADLINNGGSGSGSGGLVKLIDKFEAAYSYITNEGSMYYFKTNKDAGRYKLVCLDVSSAAGAADPSTWRTVIPEHAKDVLESVVAFNHDKFLAVHSHDVAEKLSMYDQQGQLVQERIPLPDVGSISGLTARKQDADFFFSFTSFLYAGIIQRVAVTEGGAALSQSVFREIKVAGFDARAFETKQVFVTSHDGTQIPMFIVAKKGLKMDGSNPTWLYGYGGFNISLPPSFSVARVIWMQHFNGVFACANIRGGGEYGEEWYKGGVLLKKKNCFLDFIASAEYLVSQGYTSPPKLAINGGSNGGLLVCAVVNARPDLFGAVVGQVGVLDMLKFDTWTIGYAWVSDYGSSKDSKEMFEYLLSYSPVHNVKADATYPAVLLCTSDHDDRVVPLHSYKFISAMQAGPGQQAADKQRAPLLIRIEEKAGHGAGLPLSKRIAEQADTLAFMSLALQAKSDFQTEKSS